MYGVSEVNGVKIYNLSNGKPIQEDSTNNKKKLKKYERGTHMELIQDFQFQASCSQVTITQDQRYILCTGTYAPQLKIFDTAQLSLKCLRGIDSDAVKFVSLSEDYSKIAIAEADRSIELHAQYGFHFKTRIPHYPRDMCYNPYNCNLMVSASADAIYRLTLEEGRFLQPFETHSYINSLDYCKQLNLLFAGGETLQVWDQRTRSRIANMQCQSKNISCVKCDSNGLLVGLGQQGFVELFDVRFDRRLSRIRHGYMHPIKSIDFEPNTKRIISSTKRQIRITDDTGKLFTSIQPQGDVNMFSMVPGSGVILAAMEDPKIGCFFIPQFGPAPKWIPYLQNMTEQLEETGSSLVYDEFKFITEQEVYDLQCINLVGTKFLKPYLHGYLIHLKLYNKLRQNLSSFNHEEYQQAKIDEKLQSQLPKRIQLERSEEPGDSRFKMDNADFVIDKYSEEYMLRHPNLKKQLMKEKQQIERIRLQKLERSLKIKKKTK